MAVSKRTRFEVLRRDNYTCRYCRSTEGELTVDHVTPVALGGTDEPSNLVAACRDCNAGKASSVPDAGTVADVEADALRWAKAMEKAAEITEARAATAHEFVAWFEDVWTSHGPTFAALPGDYGDTVIQFRTLGLRPAAIEEAVRIATSRYGITQRGMWRYFCGVCWNKIRELQRMAETIAATEDA